MQEKPNSPDEYISNLAPDRKEAFCKLRKIILDNLPGGFVEQMSYGMIGYVVPHSIYPGGYYVNPKLPLPFMSIASQKNHIALYHMGIYADKSLMDWFLKEYSSQIITKPDVGKSCIRFKKIKLIPYDLIVELVRKISVEDWIKIYEENISR